MSVGIDAHLPSFQHYKRGVYHDRACSSHRLDHGVLVVGYGVEQPEENDEHKLKVITARL